MKMSKWLEKIVSANYPSARQNYWASQTAFSWSNYSKNYVFLAGHCSDRENEGYRKNICMTSGFHLSSDEII